MDLRPRWSRRLAWQAACAGALLPAAAHAGPGLGVTVAVTLVSASGVCGPIAGAVPVGVSCVAPGPVPFPAEDNASGLRAPEPMGDADRPAAPGTMLAPATAGEALPRAPLLRSAAARSTSLASSVFWRMPVAGPRPAPAPVGRAELLGYRTISTDRGGYVEFTIAW